MKRTRDSYLHALHNEYDVKGTGEVFASQPLAVNRSSLIRTDKRLREEIYTISTNYRYRVIVIMSATERETEREMNCVKLYQSNRRSIYSLMINETSRAIQVSKFNEDVVLRFISR